MATARASRLGTGAIPPSRGTRAGTSAVGLEISVLIDDKACAIKHLRASLPGARPTRADRIPGPPRLEFEESVR